MVIRFSDQVARKRLAVHDLSFAALALITGLAWLGCCASAAAEVSIDKAAPSLSLRQLDGQTFDLAKFRGKVVLIHYWATWCAPCKKEMPILDAFYRRYHERGLELIGISADQPQDFAKMRRMSSMFSYPAATLNDITQNGFGPPEGFPLTYVVDGNGIVRDKFIDLHERLLRDVVLPLLAH